VSFFVFFSQDDIFMALGYGGFAVVCAATRTLDYKGMGGHHPCRA
jgi:hypothetical protein